jgi:protease I
MTTHRRPLSISTHTSPQPGAFARLSGRKIGILMESDFYEDEILYYKHRFPEEGLETHFLTRLWGQERITFHGHEYKVPFEVSESFEGMSDEELRSYDAIIVPSAIVSDRLRYSEDVNQLAPATEFLKRAFAEKGIVKGIICHGMWLVSPAPELVRGRPVVCHHNLVGDIRNMGAVYTDQDVVVDGDLITARTGGHCHQFARAIIDQLVARAGDAATAASETPR